MVQFAERTPVDRILLICQVGRHAPPEAVDPFRQAHVVQIAEQIRPWGAAGIARQLAT
jgi:hypothetical protein